MPRRKHSQQIQDIWIIYPSMEERGMFVAHSLRTDQIGMGPCVLDAYVNLALAMRALTKALREDPSLDILREAPPEVWGMLVDAEKLPDEIVHRAEKRLSGHRTRRYSGLGRIRKPRFTLAPDELQLA